MKLRHRIITITIGALLALGVALPTTAAQAVTTDTAANSQAVAVVTAAPVRSDDSTNTDYIGHFLGSQYLSLNRWHIASTVLHSKFDDFATAQLTEKLVRSTAQPLALVAGHGIWWVTGQVVRFAVTFEVLANQGANVDKAAGTIGNALIKTPLLIGFILTFLVILIFWRAWKSRRGAGVPWKKFGGVVLILTVIAVMSGAAASGRVDGDGHYDPPTGSPVWVAKVVTDGVSNFAAIPAQAMVSWEDATNADGSASTKDGPFSCAAFHTAMDVQATGTGEAATDKAEARDAAATESNVAVTKVINNLWEKTGLATWKTTQLGADNPYADYMYCRVLEQSSSIPSWNSHWLTLAGLKGNMKAYGNVPGTTGSKSPLFSTISSNNEMDASMIAWAACRPNAAGTSFTIADGWATKKDGTAWLTPPDCAEWWGLSEDGNIPDAFDIGGKGGDIRALTDDPRVINFVDALHGELGSVIQGTFATSVYVIAAFISSLVFMTIAMLVIAAKIYAIFLMVALFMLLILMLFSSRAVGEKMVPLAQRFLTITLFSFGISLILSIIALFTNLLIDMGNSLGGAGNPVTLLWDGFAPLISLLMLHNIFKKVFKLPSPVTPAGMFAWGAAGGAAGGAIGAGLVNQIGRSGRRAIERTTDRAGSALLSTVTGGRHGTSWNDSHGLRQGMDGGARKGAIGDVAGQKLDVKAGTKPGAISKPDARIAKKANRVEMRAAMRAHREAVGPNAAQRGIAGLAAAAAAGGHSLAALSRGTVTGTWKGAKTAGRYLTAEPEQEAEMQRAAAEKLRAGLATARGGISSLAAKTGAGVSAKGRRMGSTAKAVGELIKENPRNAAQFAGQVVWNSPKVHTAARTAAVIAGATMLPLGAPVAAGYLVHRAKANMAKRKETRSNILTAYRATQTKAAARPQSRTTAKPTQAVTNQRPNSRAKKGL